MLSISRVDNEQLTVLASAPISLDPSRDYRFVFLASSFGGLNGDVFDSETSALVKHITAVDSTYTGGVSGLEVFSNVPNGPADATFDQFTLGMSVPEPSAMNLLLIAGGVLAGLRLLKPSREVEHRKRPDA
jgi:hypothetical protein